MSYRKPYASHSGIALKKQYGQHFLRDEMVVDAMLERVELHSDTSVFEVGCGDGFLTRAILEQDIERLWVFEIDPEWASFVEKTYPDERLTIFQEDVLQVDIAHRLAPNQPWTLLANLPYQITFPFLHLLQRNRALLREGVIMIQDEVAKKLVKTEGRDYGYSSLFFQHYFEMELLLRIPPTAFYPAPKVYSQLLYLKPREQLIAIPDEERFWRFIKYCFAQPRRILRNNLLAMPADLYDGRVTQWDHLRAQQMKMGDFLELWKQLNER